MFFWILEKTDEFQRQTNWSAFASFYASVMSFYWAIELAQYWPLKCQNSGLLNAKNVIPCPGPCPGAAKESQMCPDLSRTSSSSHQPSGQWGPHNGRGKGDFFLEGFRGKAKTHISHRLLGPLNPPTLPCSPKHTHTHSSQMTHPSLYFFLLLLRPLKLSLL